MVRLLIDAGADVDAATPVRVQPGASPPLAAASAPAAGNWPSRRRSLTPAPPRWSVDSVSAQREVIDLLRGYGITPTTKTDRATRTARDTHSFRGDGRCRPAPRSRYVDRDSSLGRSCTPGPLDRACTTARGPLRYRSLLERHSVDRRKVGVDGDAVVLGLNVARQARGPVGTARTSLPGLHRQRCSSCRGTLLPRRASALLRPAHETEASARETSLLRRRGSDCTAKLSALGAAGAMISVGDMSPTRRARLHLGFYARAIAESGAVDRRASSVGRQNTRLCRPEECWRYKSQSAHSDG